MFTNRTLLVAITVIVAAALGGFALTGAAAAAENIHDGALTDDSTGETIYAANSSEKKSITYGYVVENVTNSGESVKLYLEFDNKFNNSAGKLSSFSGNVTCICGGSPQRVGVSSSASVVDGPDGDGVKETVEIGVQPTYRDQPIDLIVNFTGDVTYTKETSNVAYPVTGAVDDPNQDAPRTEFESVTVAGGIYTETEEATSVSDNQATLNANVWDVPEGSQLQFTYWKKGQKDTTQRVTDNQTVSGSTTVSQTVSGLSAGTPYEFKSCVYNSETGESNEGPVRSFTTADGTSGDGPTGTEGGCGSIDPVEDGSSGSDTTDSTDSSSDNSPDITNYEVTASGDEVTVSFDSDENLVDIEVDVRGAEDGTLTEEDFDGNEFEGYQATYQASTDGDYTLELITAEDGSANDGADGGDYTDTATVTTSSGGSTATPTPTDGTSDDNTSDDTPTPTEGDGTSDDDDSGESSGDDDSMDDETESPTDERQPGFGLTLAVLALLAGTLLLYRRR